MIRRPYYRHGAYRNKQQVAAPRTDPTLFVTGRDRLTCAEHGGRLLSIRIGGVELPYCPRCVQRTH